MLYLLQEGQAGLDEAHDGEEVHAHDPLVVLDRYPVEGRAAAHALCM